MVPSWRSRIRVDYREAFISCECEGYEIIPYSQFCRKCGHVSGNHIDHEGKCIFPLGQNLVVKG